MGAKGGGDSGTQRDSPRGGKSDVFERKRVRLCTRCRSATQFWSGQWEPSAKPLATTDFVNAVGRALGEPSSLGS